MNVLAALLLLFALMIAVKLDGTVYSLPAWCAAGFLIGVACTLINRAARNGGAR